MTGGAEKSYDVIIIGGASAGLTASLYCSRQNLKTLVITKDVGGQALLTNDIQNYPGFDQVKGFELMTKFQNQSAEYGTEFVYDEVRSVVQSNGKFIVETVSEEYEAEALILAFGKTPRELGAPGEKELSGRGISYCAVCDGPLYKGRRVAVIGTGPQLIDAAIYLVDLAAELFVIHTTSKSQRDQDSVKALSSRKNVTFIESQKVKGFRQVDTGISILMESHLDGSIVRDIEVDGIFIENGYIAKTEFLKGIVNLNERNEVIIDSLCHTSMDAVFACGDVTNMPYKQVVISAGQGAVAALSAFNYIQEKRGLVPIKTDWRDIRK
ncbi:MAG: FAD-dependent oxidoreductase [Thermoplasmataceae archaeon]